MKDIITDSSSLEKFREKGAVYVDKTAQLHRLITSKTSDNYFIARPRRFGKSLMISTLEAIFKGRRELFEGTAIANLPKGVEPYDWQEYPILRFDMSKVASACRMVDEFYVNFSEYVRDVLAKAGCPANEKVSPGINFGAAIEYLAGAKGKSVVILIDEYDAPVGKSLNDVDKAEQIRDILSDFYIQIKANNAYIRFMMMTGVSKFTQLSVFSALSNLTDLTIKGETADLLGYSKSDLETYFGEHMRAHAENMGLAYEEYFNELERMNDGYRFSPDSDVHMFNPFAIANTLANMRPYFFPFWASTGRPSFLNKYFKREAFLGMDFDNIEGVTVSIFDASDIRALKPETVLYQAGYLTIKEVDDSFRYMKLGIPNKEIRQDINSFLLDVEAGKDVSIERDRVAYHLSIHDFKRFEESLKAFYAKLPYGSREKEIRQSEFAYARIFNALLQGTGFDLRPEDTQSCGRADLVATDKKGTYVFEFKVDKSATEALAQIRAKDYAAPYRSRGLPIFAIGINFSSDTARVTDFAVEQICNNML